MRDTSATNRPLRGAIQVSSKTLGHISQGLYRTAAGTLKELVSNAYDADATEVVITTNPPHFDKITCRDDGAGISLGSFLELMNTGIGDSRKREGDGLSARLKRRMIGRIGIGLLAVAQMSHEFEVQSHHTETKEAFRARIRLQDYLQEQLDRPARAEESRDVGEYECEPIPFEAKQAGTLVVIDDVKRGFTSKHRRGIERGRKLPPTSFGEFLEACAKETRLSSLGAYWELLWGLSVQCPIPYWPKASAPIRTTLAELRPTDPDRDITLLVDQTRLWRPPPLASLAQGDGVEPDWSIADLSINEDVYGSRLHVIGYLLGGRHAVYPSDHRGVVVRIRDVAIGTYDKSFLNYDRRSEGPRIQQVTGELYVHEGLENALNIDRGSFNEMHPHYLHLQSRLHDALEKVFSGQQARQRRRKKRETAQEEAKDRRHFESSLSRLAGRKLTISPAPEQQVLPVVVEKRKGKIFLNEGAAWPRSSHARKTAQRIFIARAVATTIYEHNPARGDEVFLELLREIL